MCIDSSMVSIFWMSSLAALSVCRLVLDSLMSLQSSRVHNGIHDAIYHYANRQQIASIYPLCTYPQISGTNTCDGMNRLRSTVNRFAIFPNDVMDAQSVCHRPSGNWYFLFHSKTNWNKKKWKSIFQNRNISRKWWITYVFPLSIEIQQLIYSF